MHGSFLLVLLLALPAQAITYSISPDVPYSKNLNNSIQDLNRRIGGKVFRRSQNNADINIIWDTVNISVQGYAELGNPCIVHITPNVLVFNGKQTDRNFVAVVGIHEIGHCLRLEHNNNPDSIMYAHPLPNTKILDSDIVSFKRSIIGL